MHSADELPDQGQTDAGDGSIGAEEIGALTRERAGYLEERVAQDGDAEASLDHKIFSAVREQAKEKGLKYESDKMAY